MKLLNTLSTLILITLLSSPGWSTPFNELVERDGLFYKKFTDVPFTGEVTGNYRLGYIKDGKRDGAWVAYWSNGQLRHKGNYKNGKKEGAWVQYNGDGTPVVDDTGIFENGVKISD